MIPLRIIYIIISWTVAPTKKTTSKIQGQKKTHKHKQICGIVPGLSGCQNFVYVFFLMGEKKHKIPGQSREEFVYVFCSLCVFFAPQKFRSAKTGFLANRVFVCATPAIFVIVVVFRGLRSKALVFVDRVFIRHSRRFRQNPLFSAGGKDPVWLRPRFCPPEK